MSNDKGYRYPDYPYYEPGMILPDGLVPPMTGYNHENLIGIACQVGYMFLSENGVDETLGKKLGKDQMLHSNFSFMFVRNG